MRQVVRVRLLPALAAIAFLPAAPAAAQEDAAAAEAEMMAALPGLFPAEPLTAEQEARLPAAAAVAASMVPEGSYARIMDTMLPAMLGPMADMFSSKGMSAAELSPLVGLPMEDLAELTDAERLEVTALIDPIYAERGRTAMSTMMNPLRDLMVAVEPSLRAGIARAHAVRFDAGELAAISAFFATPAGNRFAGELLPLFSDPQVMSASMELLPEIMERMPQIMEDVTATLAAMPPQRGFADLAPAERARLAAVLGVDQAALKAAMGVVSIPAPAP